MIMQAIEGKVCVKGSSLATSRIHSLNDPARDSCCSVNVCSNGWTSFEQRERRGEVPDQRSVQVRDVVPIMALDRG